jgi:ABC-type multidrug transport system ATPase subunit
MTAIIEIDHLRKVYSKRKSDDVVAIEGLDLQVGRPGSVHGFLGPNGSGKTTTIRCLLGLIRPTSGAGRVFGVDAATQFHQVARRVGAIVESPKMFPNFTGRKNLELLGTMAGIAKSEVDRVLKIVALDDRDKDTFGSYSLGMKQRLAIAGALLKNPDLLILDEPANGLDPAGIAEMRLLIRGIAAEGKAVLVSSHQLAEIEQVCDDVTIINRGRLVETGPLDYIRSFAGTDSVVATIDNRTAAIAVLDAAGIVARPRPQETELIVDIDAGRSSDVTRALAEQGLYLSGLRSEHATLEQAFLNLTGGDTPPPPMPTNGHSPTPAVPTGPPSFSPDTQAFSPDMNAPPPHTPPSTHPRPGPPTGPPTT